MARVLALVPDLLFGSQLQGSLVAAGHEVELIGGEQQLRERLTGTGSPAAELLVFDLTDQALNGAAILRSLAREGLAEHACTLAFYAHVDAEVGRSAREAGFDMVVPRSRMAREGAELVARLLDRAE
jgi:DNA-binding NarL/FixJ family response regulator